ncbi:hypothetical protein FLA4_06950 [Candidatus Rickettsia kotlanii]|nr:hypothetical protein FLA4_06950 [Candidatus Rickettsia kotlanii]BDU61528.1 hypothetical protein HM2_06960 [Candidatus Rickettsia kotlanii]
MISSLESLCILKIEDIIDSNTTEKIELLESAIKAMTDCRLLQVVAIGEIVAHNDLI